MQGVLAVQFIFYQDTTKGPPWGAFLGWGITGLCVLPIPLFMLYNACASIVRGPQKLLPQSTQALLSPGAG